MDLLTNGWNILLILLGFGMLIFVHELGHFAAARWARLRCESFAIGMGPVVVAYRPGVGWAFGSTEPMTVARFGKSALAMSDEELAQHRVGETEYSLRALPLGGFVRLLGQEDLGVADAGTRPRSYSTIAIWKRMVVISAGVFANLVCAIAMFVVAFMVGVAFEAPVVGAVEAGSPAASAVARNATEASVAQPGLRVNDTIVRINDAPIWTFADVQIASAMARPGDPLRIAVERPGVAAPLEFAVVPEYQKRLGMQWLGIAPASDRTIVTPRNADRPEWAAAMEQSGLSAQGIGAGARLESVNGNAVESIDALQVAIAASNGKPVPTEWRIANGETANAQIAPIAEYETLLSPRATREAGSIDPRTVQPGLAGLVPLVRMVAVQPDSPNQGILKEGDVVVRAATIAGPSPSAFREVVSQYKANGVPLEVLRNGERLSLLGQVSDKGVLGVQIDGAWSTPLVSMAMKELGPPPASDGANRASPAADLAMLPLSRVTAVAGQPVESWFDMRSALQRSVAAAASTDSPIDVQIAWEMPTPGREQATGTLRLAPEDARAIAALAWRSPINPGLFDPLMVTLQAHGNPLTAAAMGFRQTGMMITMTYLTIDRIVRGSVAVEQLRGPVGIVHLGSRVADRGGMYLLFFLAVISVNLAVLNFLPLPIVDGGLFLYLLYERITGRPPSAAFQNAAIAVGLCLLGGIFLLTFYQDVMRLLGGA